MKIISMAVAVVILAVIGQGFITYDFDQLSDYCVGRVLAGGVLL